MVRCVDGGGVWCDCEGVMKEGRCHKAYIHHSRFLLHCMLARLKCLNLSDLCSPQQVSQTALS